VGVVEYNSGVFSSRGLNVEALKAHQAATGTLAGFPGAEREFGAGDAAMSLLEEPVDILVPAALEKQITRANAARIQAKLIVEGANGPTTPAAEEILEAKGTVVLPDMLCNAGGVSVCECAAAEPRAEGREKAVLCHVCCQNVVFPVHSSRRSVLRVAQEPAARAPRPHAPQV
jgi:glutamate dehydrogenase/leucine dehydrogenase